MNLFPLSGRHSFDLIPRRSFLVGYGCWSLLRITRCLHPARRRGGHSPGSAIRLSIGVQGTVLSA